MKHLTLLLRLLLALPLSSCAGPPPPSDDDGRLALARLRQIAYSHPEGSAPSLSAWREILRSDPRSLEAHVMLGNGLLSSPGDDEEALDLLEAAFDPERVSPTIDFDFPQTYLLASTIGRARAHRKEHVAARRFTRLALELGERHAAARSETSCLAMQLASMYDHFPRSEEAADEAIDELIAHADALLDETAGEEHWPMRDRDVIKFPGASPDPFVHCMLSSFPLSFYYRADVAAVASRQYQMALLGWPNLGYTADFVKRYEEETDLATRRYEKMASRAWPSLGYTADFVQKHDGGKVHPCIRRKIRLAVISGVMTEGHSNSESFGGALSHLDRNVFEVTYVLLAERGAKIASFTRTHPSDRVFVWGKEVGDVTNGAWTLKWAKQIESWELDVIFYFELTMSSWARRLGMARLAPVQANSIGHPITSGHDRSVIQYYISWAAAELPLEVSQTHYTEELKLLPPDIIYQYYEPRVLPGQISRIDKQPFGHLQRGDFGLPSDARVYLCMQKPLKFHPDFDRFVCGIMQRDREGLVVMHREDNAQSNQDVFEKRLDRAGCDLRRMTFLDAQPHHRLLALYRDATVVLDSYPAGGDTTTREVIEMGKPLVTLPARLLGGRWSLGYLSNIGLTESTKKELIATNTEEYINLAVKLANDDALWEAVQADLKKCAPNLFRRKEAVAAWQEMFLEISPYKQCQTNEMQGEL